jgi:hypothetical protein
VQHAAKWTSIIQVVGFVRFRSLTTEVRNGLVSMITTWILTQTTKWRTRKTVGCACVGRERDAGWKVAI